MKRKAPINPVRSRIVPVSPRGSGEEHSPVGRIDILFHRLAELGARKLEAKTNMPGIWQNFLMPIMDEKVQEIEGMGPVEFARHIGFLKPGRKRLRRAS